jgi:hypothetical protein
MSTGHSSYKYSLEVPSQDPTRIGSASVIDYWQRQTHDYLPEILQLSARFQDNGSEMLGWTLNSEGGISGQPVRFSDAVDPERDSGPACRL